MLAGQLPFHGKDAMSLLFAVAMGEARPLREINPAVPPELADLVMQLLARDPADRPQSAKVVVETLQRIERDLASSGQPTASPAGAIPIAVPVQAVASPFQELTEVSSKIVTPPSQPARGRGGRRLSWRVAAAVVLLGVVGVFAAQIVIRIKDKDGRATTIEVPDDRMVTVEKAGKTVATIPPRPPAAANAPFDTKQARAHQEAWARHLGTTAETSNTRGMKFALIPPGKFLMGSPENELGRQEDGREGPQHEVTLTRPVYMGTHTVTVGQFRAFVRATGHKTEAETSGRGALVRGKDGKSAYDPKANWQNPGYEQAEQHPVVCVSWNDAQAFCRWPSKKEGTTYTLPTEGQWEYSCRAGSRTRFFSGDAAKDVGEYAWFNMNSERHAHPVGQKQPNAWGLYDMTRNVQQFCQDFYDKDYYRSSPAKDPDGPGAGPMRVVRGGYGSSDVKRSRSAYRHSFLSSTPLDYVGFRVVLMPAALDRVRP
jgi:formylglycine-generating enzyme required for sulfatase activity